MLWFPKYLNLLTCLSISPSIIISDLLIYVTQQQIWCYDELEILNMLENTLQENDTEMYTYMESLNSWPVDTNINFFDRRSDDMEDCRVVVTISTWQQTSEEKYSKRQVFSHLYCRLTKLFPITRRVKLN